MKTTSKTILFVINVLTMLTLCGCYNEDGVSDSFKNRFHKKQQVVEQDNSVNLYAFTNQYNNMKKPDITLKEEHQKTVNDIISGFDTFLTEQKFSDFPTINSYAKKHNWTIDKVGYPESKQYYANLNDGSGVKILFERFEWDKNIWEAYIWDLTEKQCNYMVNYYKYNQKIVVETGQYGVNPGNMYSKSAYCNEINNKHVAVKLTYNGKLIEPFYQDVNKNITHLLNKEYNPVMSKYVVNLYFTDKPVTYKDFVDGVTYAVNPKNNHVTIGALTKTQCEQYIYKLPDQIQYNINDHKKCSSGYNMIEFSKKA